MRGSDRRRGGVCRARPLLFLVLATAALAFTGPGRRAVTTLARRLDARVEGFSEPNARGYARFIAPALRRLYERVADDVAAELEAPANRADLSDGRRPVVLDIGCGPGDLAALLAERLAEARIVGLDVSPGMVEVARRRETAGGRLRFEEGDVAGLEFETGSIDLVVSTLSLHHWPDPGAGFAEIGRVLRPGGTALVYDLRLLTLPAERLSEVARRAGLPAGRLRREGLSGGPLARLFVVFRIDSSAGEPSRSSNPPLGSSTTSAGAAGHARIPAAVTPGEVA